MIAALLLCMAVDVEIDVGFRGKVFTDSWCRVSARVHASDGPFEGELRIRVRSTASGDLVHTQKVALGANGHRRYAWSFFVAGREESVRVQLVDIDGDVVHTRDVPLGIAPMSFERVLFVGGEWPTLDAYTAEHGIAWALVSPESLPDHSAALLGLDTIVFVRPASLTVPQQKALRAFLQLGGRVAFFTGRWISEIRGRFWNELCPMEFTVLETRKLPVPGEDTEASVLLARGRRKSGEPILPAGESTLGIRDSWGRGEVVFLAFSLEQDSVFDVVDMDTMIDRVLIRTKDPSINLVFEASEEYTGLLDERGAPFPVVPFFLGIGILVFYVVLIGPVDYFRVKRSGRARRPWIPFIGYTAGCCILFAGWGGCWTEGAARLSNFSFLDGGVARTWSVVRAGAGGTYQVVGPEAMSVMPRNFGQVFPGPQTAIQSRRGSLELPLPVMSRRICRSFRSLEESPAVWAEWKGDTLRYENEGGLDLKAGLLFTKNSVYPLDARDAGSRVSLKLSDLPSVPLEDWFRDRFNWKQKEYWYDWTSLWRHVDVGSLPFAVTFFRRARRSLNMADPMRLQERYLDLSDVLDKGHAVLMAPLAEDVSGVYLRSTSTLESRGWIRVVVERK